jgi:hypothetical protein
LPSGALGLLLAFTEPVGFFDLLVQNFEVVKTLDYTVRQKLQTVICSVAVGCAWTKDINHTLRLYPVAAQWLEARGCSPSSPPSIVSCISSVPSSGNN